MASSDKALWRRPQCLALLGSPSPQGLLLLTLTLGKEARASGEWSPRGMRVSGLALMEA